MQARCGVWKWRCNHAVVIKISYQNQKGDSSASESRGAKSCVDDSDDAETPAMVLIGEGDAGYEGVSDAWSMTAGMEVSIISTSSASLREGGGGCSSGA